MSFGENLQFYRKRKDITQEQLAEQLDVSRQTVSKWESDSSYPEMEKILQLCDLFECPMDILIRGDAQESLREDTADYDAHMDRHSKEMTGGVAIIMAGVTFAAAAEGFRLPEFVMTAGALLLIIIGVLILIAGGMKHSRFKEKHLRIKPFYSEEERERADEKFTVRIVTGIGIILAGLVFAAVSEGLPVPQGYTAMLYEWSFLAFATAGVSVLVYAGLQKSKYNIEEYNKENALERGYEDYAARKTEEILSQGRNADRGNQLIGVVNACIMIFTTIIFLICGLGFDLWEKCWIAYPVGVLLCGIVSIILNFIYNRK